MAFRDHLDGAVKIDTINPINEMRLQIESHPTDAIIFTSVDGADGHSAAANVCLRENMTNRFGIQPAELLTTLEWAMNNRSDPIKCEENAPVM